ncbi:hypothetical protein WMZ97_05520 [Lentibacillus sp. N15]|uniref:hypothetical protein n=1 Tax=Lentibacillus songyuanensis TaxID=3136161 RepID=UPI0031BB0DC7
MPQIIKSISIPETGWLLCEFDNGEKRVVAKRLFGESKARPMMQLTNDQVVTHDNVAVQMQCHDMIDADKMYQQGIRVTNVKNLNQVIDSMDGLESIILVPILVAKKRCKATWENEKELRETVVPT